MADSNRPPSDPLTSLDWSARLESEPWSFDFFAALRLAECAHPGMPRIGFARLPRQEPLRLGQEPSVAFPPSTLARFERGDV
ncbi:MAG: type VI secretion system baseplate subunit TssG, partial [Planctomycetes bacterium]|nr:type VI secretion system baseplate subunit TssG [Planctomycetota bacterium]